LPCSSSCFPSAFRVSSINISFPSILEKSYGLDSITVGLCYIPFGVGLIIGAGVGGRSADRIRKKGGTAEHRLIPCFLFIPLNGIGLIAQGWVFDAVSPLRGPDAPAPDPTAAPDPTVHLSVVLLISFFLGFTFILPRPGTNTYAIEKLKTVTGVDLASSATGLIFGIMFPTSAIIAQLSVIGFAELGYGYYLTIIGGALALSTIPITIFVIRDIRQAKKAALQSTSPNNLPKNGYQNVGYDAIN